MIDRLMEGWVRSQIDPWRRRRLDRSQTEEGLVRIWHEQPTVALLEINGNRVRIREKDGPRSHLLRAQIFQNMLEPSLTENKIKLDTLIAIDTADEAFDHTHLPVFTFQKRLGNANILLPDIDFFLHDYYEKAPKDRISYYKKRPRGSFAGSTTGGGSITMEAVTDRSFPRLRAARYFREFEEVDFRLTKVVQCDTDDVKDALEAEGYGGGHVGWDETFLNRFIISIDGNGAACSRPLIALMSNSILLKYESQNVLYYTANLIPWQHYIPVRSDPEVIDIIRGSRRDPERYVAIAEEGKHFAEKYLNRHATYAYSAHLLAAYSGMFRA